MNREDYNYRVRQNIEYRVRLLRECESDVDLQKLCIERARRDIVWFTNTFVVTYNPRETPSILPFYCFPKQEEALLWFQWLQSNKKTGVLEKSRYTGATWLASIYCVHQFLFTPNFSGGFGSRKAELVDKIGDPDCIFEKIRMILRRLPPWLLSDADWDSKRNLIANKRNGSLIRGEGGDNIGRGGRSTVYCVDESAFLERSEKVIAALSENTDCCIHISTPNGTGNAFYRMRSCGNFPVFRLHWRDDPRRTEEWYEAKKKELTPATLAQELDIDYTASVEGVCIKSIWVNAAINAHLRIPEIATAATVTCAGLDVATEGNNKNVLVIRHGCVVSEDILDWTGLDTTQTSFKVDRLLREKRINNLCFDADGVGAGVSGTLGSMFDTPYRVNRFHGGSSASDRYWEGEERTSREKFINRRAEAYAIVAERFRKTYEVVNGIADHPPEELISIPDHPELIGQLSRPTVRYNSAGKAGLESKDDMRIRGIASPDHADALVMAFQDPSIDFSWMSA